MSDVYVQTTSGKVKLATAEEVDNMASSISGGLGGTLIGTTTAYINVSSGKTIKANVPSNTDYIIIKPINVNGFGITTGTSLNHYEWFLASIGNGALVYNNGSGFIPSAISSTNSINGYGGNTDNERLFATVNHANTDSVAAVVTLAAPTVTFTSKCSYSCQYVYVNIEAYKFN